VNEIAEVAERGVGRPCNYNDRVQPRLIEVEQWIKEGLTDYCISDNLCVGYSTWMNYKAEILELQEVYTRARTRTVQKVVNALYSRSMEKKVIVAKQKVLSSGEVVEYTEEQYIPGDVNAQKFYLINRDPTNWQPENRIENSHIIINNFQLPQLEQELQQIAEKRKALELQLGVGFEHIE
jgi:hypothetical protein